MKKVISTLLILALLILLAACNESNEKTNSQPNTNSDTNSQVEVENEQLIGRLKNYSDFRFELSKRINFDNYNLDYCSTEHPAKFYNYSRNEETLVPSSVDSFTLTIDDIEFTMPITLGDFVDLGFNIIDDYGNIITDTALYEQDNCGSLKIITPKGNTFSIFTVSKDYTSIFFKDQIVMQISIYMIDSQVDKENFRGDIPRFKEFGNLTNDSLVDDIIATLNEPKRIRYSYTLPNGSYESTSASIDFAFDFSNDLYSGSVTMESRIIVYEEFEKTDYINYFDYSIEPETLVNFN